MYASTHACISLRQWYYAYIHLQNFPAIGWFSNCTTDASSSLIYEEEWVWLMGGVL